MRRCIVAGSVVVGWAAVCGAATLDVGPGGYASISAALAVAQPGDTVRVAAGGYSTATGEAFPLYVDKAVTVEAGVVATPPNVTVQGDGSNTVFLVSKPGVVLRGLRITGGLGSEGPYAMDGGGVCVYVGAHDKGRVTIDSCLVEGNACTNDATYDGCGGGVYAGGTYCTCFNTLITNSTIRANTVNGNGGGVYGAIISRVRIVGSLIEDNIADDRGGGVCADLFAELIIDDSAVCSNLAAGDRRYATADWGGKGGGIYVASLATADIRDADIAGNVARYYGGGLFIESRETNNVLRGCKVVGNRANTDAMLVNWQPSGGGVYLRENAFLHCADDTRFYWNEAQKDGGGILVAGGSGGSPQLVLEADCRMEGNESTRDGGGLWLGPGARADVSATRLLGNACGRDGGGVHLAANARLSLSNSWITYNNAARGRGAGLYLAANASAAIERGTLVGNFAAWDRSGVYMAAGGSCSVSNSILWRNAGGSVATNAPGLNAGYSLIEDMDLSGMGVIHVSPLFVGWGAKTAVHVDAGAAPGGDGTVGAPFQNLPVALDAFDFTLATGSPCLNRASDGGNMGAPTGTGGTPGNVTAELRFAAGTYDIRARNIAMTKGVVGAGSGTTTIRHTVFGHVEDTFFRDLTIADDAWYGGVVTRANALLDRCRVTENTCLYDGGGIYVAGGVCTLSNSMVDANANTNDARGGGIWVGPGLGLVADDSAVSDNRSVSHGGGVFADRDAWLRIVRKSIVARNVNDAQVPASGAQGGGIYALDATTVTIDDSRITDNRADHRGGGLIAGGTTIVIDAVFSNNVAGSDGGGLYLNGIAVVSNSHFVANRVEDDWAYGNGGGVYVSRSASATIQRCMFDGNYSISTGGGIACYGDAAISDTDFFRNASKREGGAVEAEFYGSPYCVRCVFWGNRSTNRNGGALYVRTGRWPRFVDCRFNGNTAASGGAVYTEPSDAYPLFDRCTFNSNVSACAGGALVLYNSQSAFASCTFDGNAAGTDGGMAHLLGSDASRFLSCTNTGSRATGYGGGLFLQGGAAPVVHDSVFRGNVAGRLGGAVCADDDSAPRFLDASFIACGAVSATEGADGGAFGARGNTVSCFERCLFEGNSTSSGGYSADGGAAHLTHQSRTTFLCTRFLGNYAADNGGAISAQGSAHFAATNVLMAGNSSHADGGAVHINMNAQGQMRNCTVASNITRSATAGGLYLEAPGTFAANSCILFGNAPNEMHGTGTPSLSYSCIQGGYTGTGNIAVDPLLVWPGASLGTGSLCINAGDPDPAFNDPDGSRNDMGWTGGPRSGCAGLAMDATLIGPLALCATPGQRSESIVGRVFITNLTQAVGAVPALRAELGMGDGTTHPSNWTVWVPATYSGASGSSDDYIATIPAPTGGVARFAWRFSLSGSPWLYADADGSANDFQSGRAGEYRAGDIVYEDFGVPTNLALVGACSVAGVTMRLVPASANQKGAVWYRYRVPVGDGDGFDTHFTFRLHPDGAHGFAFVLQDVGPSALGSHGSNIGYSGLVRSLAVEFDTWSDGSDPNGNHISIQSRGATGNSPNHAYSVGSTTSVVSFSDSNEHQARVRYAASRLQVFFDDIRSPVLDVGLPNGLASALGVPRGWVWAGFTASTGGNPYQNADLLRWTFAHAPDVMFPDRDGDGLPDWWERLHFGSDTGADPNDDSDSDGVSNTDEYTADTDPNDPDCYLRMTAVEMTGTGVNVHWRGGRAATQVLEARDSLTTPAAAWTPAHTVSPPTPVDGSYLHAPPVSTQRFYRIRIQP